MIVFVHLDSTVDGEYISHLPNIHRNFWLRKLEQWVPELLDWMQGRVVGSSLSCSLGLTLLQKYLDCEDGLFTHHLSSVFHWV